MTVQVARWRRQRGDACSLHNVCWTVLHPCVLDTCSLLMAIHADLGLDGRLGEVAFWMGRAPPQPAAMLPAFMFTDLAAMGTATPTSDEEARARNALDGNCVTLAALIPTLLSSLFYEMQSCNETRLLPSTAWKTTCRN